MAATFMNATTINIAVVNKGYPQSIHLAYPGSDYQVEVFDPSAAKARAIVSTGQVKAIG